MKTDPFTGEIYQGYIVQYDCDGCGETTDYEEDAYGQDFLVLCDTCAGRSKVLLDPADDPTCYQCEQKVMYLFEDSRCKDCTRLTPDEVLGSV